MAKAPADPALDEAGEAEEADRAHAGGEEAPLDEAAEAGVHGDGHAEAEAPDRTEFPPGLEEFFRSEEDGAADPRALRADLDPVARWMGLLYACYCFDFVVDIAQSVALDAVRDPLKYRTAVNPMAFHEAQAEFGTTTDWLTGAQRAERYSPFFSIHPLGGATSKSLPFDNASVSVQNAANACSAEVYGHSIDSLLGILELRAQNFRVAVFDQWSEDIVAAAALVAHDNIRRAGNILRDPGVATRFGVNRIDKPNWPFENDDTGAGSLLIERASKELGADPSHLVNGVLFTNIEGVAQAGREVLWVLGRYPAEPPGAKASEDRPLADLLSAALRWQRSLELVQPSAAGALNGA